MSARVIHRVEDLEHLDVASLPKRPEPKRVLMCTPDYFEVLDVKNAFMEGNVGAVDHARARAEWDAVRAAFEAHGHEVVTIPGVEGLEDMVFAANQTLPGIRPDGRRYVVLGRMRFPSREREVSYYRAWFEREGYEILELSPGAGWFEGQGDAIWHPGRQLLWGGHGHRTSENAYVEVSATLDVPVVVLELVHPMFYHLDTCFCVLDERTVMIFPGAFDPEGRRMIARLFPRVIEVSEREATSYFTCNALAVDGKTVFLQRGAREAVAHLRECGYEVVEVDTDEFMKSGGSVFCMKQMIY